MRRYQYIKVYPPTYWWVFYLEAGEPFPCFYYSFFWRKRENRPRASEREIARKANFTTSTINQYILDTRIPPHIREKAFEMEAKSVLEKVCSFKVIPLEVKTILYEKAIIEQGNAYRLTGKKFDYMKEFCSACNLPPSLLKNTTELENLINKLLSYNFEISDHMITLLNTFVGYDTTAYQSKQEEYEEISIH